MRSVSAAVLGIEYAALLTVAYAASTPRGVGPEFLQFYQEPTEFTCISNPSIKIPFSRVNDDYCDCPDGSDEPGTSACAHLSSLSPHSLAETVLNTVNASIALPGFYCENKGHIPSYVPFTSVNDGVCDYEVCCDGSEEWEHVGGVKCSNKCDAIGKEWRKVDAARKKSAAVAIKKREELVKEATKLRQQVLDRISGLNADVSAAEAQVKKLEEDLAETERNERGKTVKSSGAGRGGKLGVLVGLARQRTEELRTSLIGVRLDRDASKARLEELETIMSTFKEEYNPNFNDEGVKRAVRAWEDYVASKGAETSDAAERDLDALTQSDKDNGIDWEEYESDDESDTDVLYAFENYLPDALRTWVDQKLRELRVTLIENGILADSSHSSGSESKRVSDARNKLDEAKRTLDQHRNSLRDSQDDVEKDFGPDDIFRALKGTCVETDSGEYTYQVCFLDKTFQKPKKGGGQTNMGGFTRLERIVVDEDLPASGKGVGSGERIAMKHENGQHCWNGPNRSTTVILACSEENEIWKIMEEEKCVYRMEVGTPAVCEAQAALSAGKDEL